MPLKKHGCTIPHLKALISGKLEPRVLRCGSTFILYYALLKKAILLHTEGLVKTEMASTVGGAGMGQNWIRQVPIIKGVRSL